LSNKEKPYSLKDDFIDIANILPIAEYENEEYNLKLLYMNAEELKFPDNYFDTYISNLCLMLVNNP